MSVFINAIESMLKRCYQINVCGEISELSAPVCLVETCWFMSNIHDKNYWGAVEDRLHRFKLDKQESGRKVMLLNAELSPFRLPGKHRDLLLEVVDVWVVTDPYLHNILKAIDITPHGFLCDCINPDLFRPAEKELSVIAIGALKHIKNIDWIVEVYEHLEDTGIKRMYLGGAALWSAEVLDEDVKLIHAIEETTDVFIQNASSIEVAYHTAHAAFAVNNTWHDCSSRANEELLMSGVISLHGDHPLFEGRPGFKVKTPEEAVEKIFELTDGFEQLPDPKLHEASRQWALKKVSSDVFMTQFEDAVRSIL
jgi:glycosyltransferase involved in cell wall biosynthesis